MKYDKDERINSKGKKLLDIGIHSHMHTFWVDVLSKTGLSTTLPGHELKAAQ